MSTPALPEALTLPDGTRVRARSLRTVPGGGVLPTYGLYLGTARTRRRFAAAMPWHQDWIWWRDFGVPKEHTAAVAAITSAYRAMHRGERVECACPGGVGRTGTVLACLVVLTGSSDAEAVSWVRRNYTKRAAETPWQRRWVERFARG